MLIVPEGIKESESVKIKEDNLARELCGEDESRARL